MFTNNEIIVGRASKVNSEKVIKKNKISNDLLTFNLSDDMFHK